MPNLSKADVNLIANTLKGRKSKVKATKAWLAIYEKYQLGRLQAGWLYLEFADRDKLRAVTIADTGFDPMGDKPKGNRTEVAGDFKDEKWSSESIQRNRIYCASHNALLRVKDEALVIPVGAALWLNHRDIDSSHYSSVVVVENLEAFVYWSQFNLPPQLDSSLIIYRGHDHSARAVIDFLEQLSENIQVVVFSDPDPAGLSIMMSTPRVTRGLVPAEVAKLKACTHQKRFAKQLNTLPNLLTQMMEFSEVFQGYCRAILREGIATSQEKLCKNQVSLIQIDL